MGKKKTTGDGDFDMAELDDLPPEDDDSDEEEYIESNDNEEDPVKIQVYREEQPEKKQSAWQKGLTPLNIMLFIIAAVLMALAIIEAGRSILDFVAAFVFLAVMVKIFMDGYGLGNN